MESMQEEKEADSNGENNMDIVQKVTIVTVNNKGSRPITLARFHVWMGNVTDTQHLPQIGPHGRDEFTVLNGLHGATVGFQYNGDTISGVQCGFMVAWDAPSIYKPPNVLNKVVTYGNTRELANKNTWQDMLEKLGNASSTTPHARIVHQEPDSANLIVDVNMDYGF